MKRAFLVTILLAVACSKSEKPAAESVPLPPIGNAAAAKAHMEKYACQACHVIPGMGEGGALGPDLTGFAVRTTLNGRVQKNPQAVAAYLLNPTAVDAQTSMPAVGLSEEEAKDIAAFLETLK